MFVSILPRLLLFSLVHDKVVQLVGATDEIFRERMCVWYDVLNVENGPHTDYSAILNLPLV